MAQYVPVVEANGDSHMAGVGGTLTSFRNQMYTRAQADGLPFFMVGASSGTPPVADPWHDGNGGAPISPNMTNFMLNRMCVFTPDITILEGGTINVSNSDSPATIMTQLGQLLDLANSGNQKGWHRILCLNIFPRTDAFALNVAPVNALIPATIAAKSYAPSVTLVDVSIMPGLTSAMYTDGLHFNDTGHVLVGNYIYDKYLKAALVAVISDLRRSR